jgi:hypothetical protein
MNENEEKKVTNGEIKEDQVETPDNEMSLINVSARGVMDIEKEIQKVEKQIEFFNRIKNVSLKLTKEQDWVFQQDSPYLMDRGTENIAIAWGIDISDVKLRQEWEEDDKGRYYTFIATGKAYSKKLGRYIEDIGVCSQRDKFFGWMKGEMKEIHDVDMANIRKKAVTNLYSRLIKRCIGLMNVTVDDLKEAGLDIKKIHGIKYNSGSQKAKARLSEKGKETQKKLGDMLLMMASEDKKVATELLKKYSSWKDDEGKEHYADSLSKMSEKWINTVYGKVKEDFDKIGDDQKQMKMDEKEKEKDDDKSS